MPITSWTAGQLNRSHVPRRRAIAERDTEPVKCTRPGAKDANAAAVEAYKAKHGLWALPTQPHVDLGDAGKGK